MVYIYPIFQQNMEIVFFFYGLGFFILAVVLYISLLKMGKMPLTNAFWMLFWFALLHGLQEWADMLNIIKGPSNFLFLTGLIVGTVSFGFLLQFGINMICVYYEKWSLAKGIPFIATIMFFWITFFTGNSLNPIFKNAGRFSLGFLGALLSTYGLYIFYNRIKAIISVKIKIGLLLLITSFGTYVFFGGLIITPIAGLPVQLFRMGCAILAAIGSVLILELLKQFNVYQTTKKIPKKR